MPRNFSRLVMVLGAAFLAGAPSLHAQTGQPVRGDVDGDGRVTAADARIVSDFLVGKPVPAGVNVRARGDVNGDGRITSLDAAIIARSAAGRDMSRFPVGQALPDGPLAMIECTADVRAATVACDAPGMSGGARGAAIIVGGQHTNVTLANGPVTVTDSGTFEFTVTIKNLLFQAMGVDSLGVSHPDGVRVFFYSGPNTLGGTGGMVYVHGGAQNGAFFNGPTSYYQYSGSDFGPDGILSPQETSLPRLWQLKYDPTVLNFSFILYLSTEVQFTAGWIDVYPPYHTPSPTFVPVDSMLVGQTLQLVDTVRNRFGSPTGEPSVNWARRNPGNPVVATVNASGLVTAVATGVDSIKASLGARSGTVQILVTAPSADSTTITASPTTIAAGDSSLITVQVRDGFGRPVTTGGATVELTTTGANSVLTTVDSTATTVIATDVGNGTYTAKLSGTTAGATATVTGKLNGVAIGDNATVTITAGGAANMVKSAGDGQSATAGTAVATAPAVTITDAHGNPVAGVSVTFAVTGGGGSVTGSPAVTNAAGVATVGSWTLGTTAGANTLDASATGLTTVTFTATGTAGAAANMVKSAGDGQTATAGSAVAIAPAVTITDANNNPVSGVSVTFAVASGGTGSGVTGIPAVTNASGVATVGSWTLGNTAGANTLDASAPGVTTVTFTATGIAGPPANMVKSAGDGQTATAGSAVTVAPAVTITDANNNPVSGVSVTFAVASGGTGSGVTGTPATTNASGVATVGSWTLGNTAGANTLDASSTGLTTVTFTATATPGAVDHFVVEAAAGGNIPDQLAGTPFNVKVTARDQFNNTATGFTGTVGFTSTPGGGITAGAGPSAAFVAGVLSSHAITMSAGDYTLTATRTAGTETGTSNSFQVQAAPTAVADGPTPTSVPGDPYHTAFNTTFNLATLGVMANDTRGLPLATVVAYGGGALGGAVTDHAAGSTVTPLPGHPDGSLTVNANGSLAFTPPAGFTGLYTFSYRIGNVRGTSDATVTIAVGVRPAVTNDTYPTNLLGNVPINTATSSSFNVTTNDAGDAKVLALGTSTNGATTLAAGGTFIFTPNAGYTGPASFTYTVTNGFGTTGLATVNMTVSGIAWFIDKGAAAGDGRLGTPFNDLNTAFAAATKPLANQPIFLYSDLSSYTGGVTLLAGQRLVGEGATGASFASVMNVTWPADAGPQPSIGGTSPTVISGLTLGSGNTLQGFNLGGAGTLTGTSFGTLTISEVGINTTGQALNLTTGTISGSFPQVRSTGGTNNVFLSGVSTTGTTTLGTNADALSGATGDALVINGGNGSFTYAGPITNATTLAVNVSNKTGGTVTLSGDINPAAAARGISLANNSTGTNTFAFTGANQKISSATSTGVSLSNNTGATISFTGGTLAITTTTGNGFSATGGGTVNVTGATNSISSTSGVALTVTGTTIGASGLTFRTISAGNNTAAADPVNGIVLNGTGAGGLTVTGDGSTLGSGGTIQNINGSGIEATSAQGLSLSWMNLTSADLADGGVAGGTCDLANVSTCKGAIDLTNVTGVSLTRVIINGSEEQGIVGSNVTGFSMANSTVQNAGNAAAENGVYFLGLYGTVNITSSIFTGNAFENFGVLNTTGSTPLVMTVTGSTFSSNSSIGGDGLLLDVRDGTNTTVTVKGSTFTANKDDHFQVAPSGSAIVNATFGGPTLADRNTLTGGHPSPTGQGIAMRVGGPFTGSFTFDINNNSVNGAIPTAINTGSGSMSGGVINGKIRNNLIGTAGSTLSCSAQGSGILVETNGQGSGGTYNALVSGNTLRQCFDKGIDLLGSRDTGSSALNATVTGNDVDELTNVASRWAIRLETGSSLATETGAICADISGNTLHALTQVDEMSIRQRSNTPVRLPGYTGGAGNDAAVVTYLQTRNPAGGTATASHTLATNFLNTSPAGSACPTPP